jgi:PAS domain S-box-containing protein
MPGSDGGFSSPPGRDGRERLLRLLGALGDALAAGGGSRTVLQAICQALVDELGAAFARVWTLESDGQMLVLRASAGLYTHLDGEHSRIRVGDLKIGQIASQRRPFISNDLPGEHWISDPNWVRETRMKAFAGHPLLAQGRVVGVLALFSQQEFSSEVLSELGSIADTVAQFVDRERTAAMLRERNDQYRRIFEATLDGLLIADPESGLVIEVNAALGQIYRRDPEQFRGQRLEALIHPEDRGALLGLRAAAQAGGDFQTRFRGISWAGDTVHCQLKATTLVYGGRQHLLCVIRDVTEEVIAYRLLEQRLEARQDVTALLDGSAVGGASIGELRGLLNLVLPQVQTVLDYAIAVLFLVEGDQLVPVAYHGPLRSEEAFALRIPLQHSVSYQHFQRHPGEALIVDDLWSEEPAARDFRASQYLGPLNPAYHGSRSVLAVPLQLGDRVIGALRVEHREPARFRPRHREFLVGLANQAALAIDNVRLYQEARGRAVLEERQRLSRELHDSVSQTLNAITLAADSAGRQALAAGAPLPLRPFFEFVATNGRAAADEMRSLIFELRPELLEREGLMVALEQQITALRARHEVAFEFTRGEEPSASPAVKEALYRIAQESLRNAVRHAGAATVRLAVAAEQGDLVLEVSDDGRGFEASAPHPRHLGLRSMRERAAAAGGTVEVVSAPDAGTRVVARVPVSYTGGLA